MSVIGHSPLAGASGAAGGDSATYVDDVFSTFLYEGSASAQTITNGIDLSSEGGMVWLKNRSGSYNHNLYDTERGVKKALYPNLTSAEYTENNSVGTFNSDGFAFAGGGDAGFNTSGSDFVSWTFRKAPGFFDVVTYTGTGSNQTISHSLGSVPGMIMIHCRDGSHDWEVYHRSTGATKSFHLNSDDAQTTDSTVWNNTTPTSSVFTVGTSSNVNQNGHGYVAYVFAHDDQSFGTDSDEAIIKCGSYTGNGTAGHEVNLGFEPQFVLLKGANAASTTWWMFDVMRGMVVGSDDERLRANATTKSLPLSTYGANLIKPTPTGFALETTSGEANNNGTLFVYMAIRRPHKPPEAGTEVFAVNTRNGNETANTLSTAGFPVDFAIITPRNVAHWAVVFDRLRGAGEILNPHSTRAEVYNGSSLSGFDSNTAIELGTDSGNQGTNRNSQTYVDHLFKRAPGFFDVVAYTGTGSLSGVNHNLGVTPELKIIKSRSNTSDWVVGGSAVAGENGYIYLHSTAGAVSSTNYWDGGDDGATQFSVRNTNAASDSSGWTYVAYLFATLDGISKVGSYSGTGSNIDVDCGFTAGARFVMIKRTDSTGDWYYWDTARGIVSGNDPYLRFSSTDAETTNTDYIDPLNAGFTVTSSAPAALNASGGTYLFLAIA